MHNKPQAISAVLTLDTNLAETAPEAFAAIRAEIEAVPADGLVPINLNVAAAARRGLAVAERIEPLLPALAALPDLEFGMVERLGTYALAVLHADDLATELGSSRTTRLAILLQEAAPLREIMLRAAEVLVLAGLISRARVAAIRSSRGPAGMAKGLQTLGRLYREHWDDARDKVPVTFTMIERAITLSATLNEALGVRDIDDDPLVEPANPRHRRAQAFTLFCRAYDECRRGISYLRWHHGDADRIAPSLYSGRTGQPHAGRGNKPKVEGDGTPAAEVAADVSFKVAAVVSIEG